MDVFSKKILDTVTELHLDRLSKGGDVYFSILSAGMRYLITPKDKVLVRKTPCEQISHGDIIVYRRADGEFTVHRVLSKRTEKGQIILTAKADTHKNIDPPVRTEQIIGKVVAVKKRKYSLRIDTGFGKAVSWLMYFYSSIWFYSPFCVICRRIFKKALKIKRMLFNINSRKSHVNL